MRTEPRGKHQTKEAALAEDLASFEAQMSELRNDVIADSEWGLVEEAQALPDPMARIQERGGLGPDLPTFIRDRHR